jgi:ATP-dependent DNA helicase RecG
LQLLAKTPTLSAKQLAQQLGLSSRAIEKNIAQLKADGRLKRVGAAKGGYWEVVCSGLHLKTLRPAFNAI